MFKERLEGGEMSQDNVKKLAEVLKENPGVISWVQGTGSYEDLAKSILEAIELDEGAIKKELSKWLCKLCGDKTYKRDIAKAIAQSKAVIKVSEKK